MSWLEAVQFRLPGLPRIPGVPPPERRSESQIDCDLEDEFAFHIDRSASDLMKDGIDPNEARRRAAARFGDVVSIKRECRRIALRERIMLQRVNFVMMMVVLVIVVVVGVQVMITQRYNTLALQAITTDLAKMKFESGAGGSVGGAPARSEPRAHLAPGDVVTLQVYGLSDHGEWDNLTRQVEADGMLRFPMIGEFKAAGLTPREAEDTARELTKKVITSPQVSLYVESQATATDRLQPSIWRQVDKDGSESEGGASVEILATSDIRARNMRHGGSTALLSIPGRKDVPQLFISFAPGFDVWIHRDRDYPNPDARGRWTFDGDRLVLDVSAAGWIKERAGDHFAKPLYFKQQNPDATTRSSGYIYTDGSIARPGVYGYPSVGRLTVARFIAASGGITDESKRIRVSVTSLDPDRNESRHVMLSDLRNDPSLDFYLTPGDLVLFEEIGDDGQPIKWDKTTERAEES